ncbi:MAG: DUF3526 domain-containing protein [Candidatus Rokubacteria bacterium]|nr:DUF3526 domain-containing protein [Candidatus Rokubacteria bacterium]
MSRALSTGRHLLAAEWRLVRRDRAFWAALALLVAGLAAASVSGAVWLRGQEVQVAEATGPTHDRETDAARGRQWVALPPTALAMLSVGHSDVHATSLRLSVGTPDAMTLGAPIGNPVARVLGRFDVAFVIVVLAPLIVIAVTFDVLAADREAGRLALAVAGGRSIGGLLVARLGLRAGLLVACAVAVPVAAVVARAGVPSGDVPLLVLWALVVMAYLGSWAAVGALANARGARSATSLVALVAGWAVVVLAAPALLGLVARTVHPTPSRPALVVAMWGAVTPEDVPGFYAGLRREDDALPTLVASFEEEVARQQDMAARWRFVSPAAVARDAFDAIAGTGLDRHRAFVAQVHRYRSASQRGGAPAFAFAEPPASATVGRVLAGLAALIAGGVVVALATARLGRRASA